MTAAAVVRERPILFSGEMVRAILDGRKTMTRRVMKPQPEPNGTWNPRRDGGRGDFDCICDYYPPSATLWNGGMLGADAGEIESGPYGEAGDRLWVRETWEFRGTDMNKWGRTHRTQTGVVRYAADGSTRHIDTDWQNVERWMGRRAGGRPSIHMPRWASRITLEITDVRVERLQEISSEDCEAEGLWHASQAYRSYCCVWRDSAAALATSRQKYFGQLWDSLNAKRGFGWGVNPWVWVISFTRVTP